MANEQNEATTLLNAGLALSEPKYLDKGKGVPYIVIPSGYKEQDLERMLPNPTRKRGKLEFTQSESLCVYAIKHGCEDESTLYADVDLEKQYFTVLAVIDEHAPNHACWRDHTAKYTPRHAIEWMRWNGKNGKTMTQSEFAAWLEDNLGDIASVEGMPTGTDMLKMALAFEAAAEKRFKQKINLQSGGLQFEFIDDEDKDTRTKMQVFEKFTLGMPVFEGSNNAYPVESRLKYRVTDGKVTFWYELIRPDRIFSTAVFDQLEDIQSKTGFALLYGKP